MVGVMKSRTKTFNNGSYLRFRIVLATLSSTPIRITNIRDDDPDAPGLSPSEISFIRLMDKITKGSTIQINDTGTTLTYTPGILVGGHRLDHVCHPSRSLSYYLEPLLMLAPFARHPLSLALHGPTHSPADLNIDTLAAVSVPLLRRLTLGAPLNPQVEVRKRGAASGKAHAGGVGGLVNFRCDIARAPLPPVELLECGFVKRIRGLAFGNKVSPAFMGRMVDATRAVLNRFLPDVYVHTDHNNTPLCGAGFGLHLVAETTEGCLLGADWCGVDKDAMPERVAQQACFMLLEEVEAAGCVDSSNTCLALLYCALADSDVSRVRVGRLSDAAVQFLRDLNTFFGVVFKIKMERKEDDSDDDADDGGSADESGSPAGILMSCIGVGHTNTARSRF